MVNSDLGPIKAERRSGRERFRDGGLELECELLAFWQWSASGASLYRIRISDQGGRPFWLRFRGFCPWKILTYFLAHTTDDPTARRHAWRSTLPAGRKRPMAEPGFEDERSEDCGIACSTGLSGQRGQRVGEPAAGVVAWIEIAGCAEPGEHKRIAQPLACEKGSQALEVHLAHIHQIGVREDGPSGVLRVRHARIVSRLRRGRSERRHGQASLDRGTRATGVKYPFRALGRAGLSLEREAIEL